MGKKGIRGNIGADTDAIIKESDLIEFDGSFGNFAKLLSGTQKSIEDFMNALSSYAPKIRQNLQSLSSVSNIQIADSDKLRLAAQMLDQMYDAQMKLVASSTETAKVIALANEATDKNAKANKLWAEQALAADGSINQLNARIKELTSQWTALSDAERQGAQGQQLIKQIANETLAIRRLNAAVKDEINTQLKLDSVNKQLNAARSTEMQQVSTIRQELNKVNRERELEIKAANAAIGSYDQLAAQYELGKLKLKGMAHQTEQQIQLFEAESKKLAQLYKDMMAMQEATGKHTLSVGDYGKAFRSLSTETGMLVRELPSLAVSANTFFLAISNNLPMFMSAVNRMKKENKALAAQGMATTSVFKTVMKSVLSWQTAVIVILSLLSKYGSRIVDWFKNLFKHVQKASSAMEAFSAQMGVLGEAHKEIAKNSIELDLIVDRLKKVDKGTKEWKDGVAAVNAITKKNLDDTTATIGAIEDVTEAYKQQALQLAINEAVVKRLADEALKESGISQSALPTGQNDFFSLLPDKYYKEGKEATLSDKDRKALSNYHDAVILEWQKLIKNNGSIDFARLGVETVDEFREKLAKGEYTTKVIAALNLMRAEASLEAAKIEQGFSQSVSSYKLAQDKIQSSYKEIYTYQQQIGEQFVPLFKAIAKQEQELRKYWPKMSKEAENAVAGMYDIEELLKKQREHTQRTYTRQFEFDPWYEAKKQAEALAEKGATEAETIKLWEQKKLAVELAAYGEAKDKRKKYWDDQQKKLEADLKHGLITRQQYAEWEKAIERQRILDLEALEAKHLQDTLNIQRETVDKETKLFLSEYEKLRKTQEEQLKYTTDPEKIKQMLRDLNMWISEIETAHDAEGQSAESAEAYSKALEALHNQINTTTTALIKMNVEQIKANTDLTRLGRAASALGQKRNLKIATDNIENLNESIKKLRKTMAGLDPNSDTYSANKDYIQKQIDAYIQQMQTNLNRIDVSKLTSSDGDLITRMIETSIDAAQPERLLASLRKLGLGNVFNAYIKEAIGEADPDIGRVLEKALEDNGDDIEAAIASLEPEMQEAVRKALANVGMKAGDDLANVFKKAWNTTKQWFSQTLGYLSDLAQAYADLAQAKADAAAEATEAAQEEYDKEKALLEAGYANQVETKWAEYQEKKAIQQQAEADAKKAAQVQADLETAQQTMSLITAAANIFEAVSDIPYVGIPLAVSMIATMFGAFVAAKSKAREAAAVQYGEGHAELIGGGSHASGNDSPLAYDTHGRERRVEGGEVVGIFRRRAVHEIGASRLIRNIDNINKGRYTELATKAIDHGSNLSMLAQSVETSHADLSKLESGVNKIAKQGETRTYVDSMGNLVIHTPYSKTTYIRR